MNTFAELCGGDGVRYLVRWRGKQEGPYSPTAIEAKLVANEIGLLHEIYLNDQWVTIRDFIAEKESAQRAVKKALEERERRAREIDLRRKDQEESAIHDQDTFSNEASFRRPVLESSAPTGLKTTFEKWPWILFTVSLIFWYFCAELQSWLIATAQQDINAEEQIKSPVYQFGNGFEAFIKGYSDDPFGVAPEEWSKEAALKSELNEISTRYQKAKIVASTWLFASLVMLGLGIWDHRNYFKPPQSRQATAQI